jgi:hypothetical protein
MAYSTDAQFRGNVPRIDTDEYSVIAVEGRIVEADKEINQDVSTCIDTSLIPAIDDASATPDYINLLSQYKTAELSLVAIYGYKREVTEVSDIQYWQKKYDDKLAEIKSGSIELELSDGTDISTGVGTFSRTARTWINTVNF